MLRYRPRLLHLHTYVMLRDRPRLLHLQTYMMAAKSVCIRVGSTKLGKTSKKMFLTALQLAKTEHRTHCCGSTPHNGNGAGKTVPVPIWAVWQPRLFERTCSERAAPEKKRKVQFFCCFPVAKRKSIKKQGILKQHLSTPGVHKRMQIPVKNDEKIKHNGIYHILWPKKMMIASQVLQIPWYKHEGHHKDSWEHDKTHAR